MSETPLSVAAIAEGRDLECKRAAGRDGSGEVPQDFFKSYSAMANTCGGTILLGVDEKPRGTFVVTGIAKPDRLLADFWSQMNNPQKVSVNLLTDDHVDLVALEGKAVVRVRVPRAYRRDRPVFIQGNPLTGTYRRNHEGDFRCDEESVRRMMAERVSESRDGILLPGFNLKDIDLPSLAAYRNRFRSTKPTHPFLDESDTEFLRQLGGWTRDRDDGREGLTLAGLLMFGRLRPILDAVPHYVVDYQEWADPGQRPDARWEDRVTTDGTWSGNLFDFYRRVYERLTSELKVPFRLKGDARIDETPVHEALREALVNTLIHADYSNRASVLVIKRPGLFGFRNPGTMRLPLEEALKGGTSDCRNRNLQKMFQLVGLGEQAGSGVPKINRNWQQQHWRLPEMWERVEPDQTLLAMRMMSLLPPEVVQGLERRFGARLRALTETQRLVLATVAIEGKATHGRIKTMTPIHPADITKELAELVSDGYLDSSGYSRGTHYFFPGEGPQETGDLLSLDGSRRSFGGDLFERLAANPGGEQGAAGGSVISDPDSILSDPGSGISDSSSVLKTLPADQAARLWALAAPIRARKRAADPEAVRAVVVQLCRGVFLSSQQLAELLGRRQDTIRAKYLNPMVNDRQLELEFPGQPTSPNQRYRSIEA